MLAEFAFAVGQEGYRQWEDDAIILVISPSGSEIIVNHVYRSPPPSNMIGRNKFDSKEN